MSHNKLLLIILDGVPYANWRRLFGNLEGWVEAGEARVWRMRSVLPSTSASCYASIHTGLLPQVHRIWDNADIRRLEFPDIFSEAVKAGLKTGAVTHSYWSEFFNRAPFDVVRDIEYDEPEGPITHGRFHTMHGYGHVNQMTPADYDLFGTLTRLAEVKGIDYGILHTCTLDSMGHRFYHDCEEMDDACFKMDATLAPFVDRWRRAGYEVIVTADHGQDARGHHGGTGSDQRDFALYYFGPAEGPAPDTVLNQLSLAPTVLGRLGVPVPETMKAAPFLR
ncbi:alkaline phosphatase family protein [Albidovulum sp.]|uniref:alkaline phosphatase family protein n=1 Tax=Albidovulum sp. TaxID=1872424 RepID=UPI001DB42993|nr:alkaline phosphatase family protein [Paracoccaceae bacterium]MCC0046366.1 alkaline phosphatase family protein [Defluviimonas sp.]HPE26405.1 alkaline phosphatase family protein [Albidovulum sp.]MCB2138772.1 alkaline phosphatase family protein [Paracoccaceae bacterium]MCB2159318.1 alkaline phosphatase family protein [Paracoccaceae bacterium]